jgi:hypothetical protein
MANDGGEAVWHDISKTADQMTAAAAKEAWFGFLMQDWMQRYIMQNRAISAALGIEIASPMLIGEAPNYAFHPAERFFESGIPKKCLRDILKEFVGDLAMRADNQGLRLSRRRGVLLNAGAMTSAANRVRGWTGWRPRRLYLLTNARKFHRAFSVDALINQGYLAAPQSDMQ